MVVIFPGHFPSFQQSAFQRHADILFLTVLSGIFFQVSYVDFCIHMNAYYPKHPPQTVPQVNYT